MSGHWRNFALILIFVLASSEAEGQTAFSRGVNLTGWFQAPNARQIQFSKFTKTDFENIKSLGCDVIRLPINLHAMTNGEPDYIPDPLFLHFLDQAVDWAEELQIHLILDNHTFDPAASTDPAVEAILVKVWTHMASHYRDRSEYVYYEVLNEPHGIDDAVWSDIQQNVIDAIRTEDTQHFIVVGPANWNSYNNLKNLPVYTDPKLIYTFHFYDPFVFTHQGASWTDPSMVPLAGVPFPFASAGMPATPNSLRGTWIEGALNSYANDGTSSKVRQLIDVAVAFKNQRGVPLFCGEFGVYIPNSPDDDRVAWYELVRSYLNEQGIPWTIWDYTGGFGLFEKNSAEYFNYDLHVPLLEALDFSVPPQEDYIQKPLRTGFDLYLDYFGEGITNASATGNGVLDFYSSSNPQAGSYCIYWTGVGQYDPISFDFKRDLDLYLLKAFDHTLEFYVRGNSSSTKFDVRFIDSKKNTSDRPWRMGKTLSDIPADNEWHFVQIPLKDLEEKGAWDGAWYPPVGNNFDWRSVDRFEIIPEHQSLEGVEFMFDQIRVTGEEITVSVAEENTNEPLLSVYPNPVNNTTSVNFSALRSGPVEMAVYNPQGQKVSTLFHEVATHGEHIVFWDGTDTEGKALAAGLYFIRMEAGSRSRTIKIMMAE
ncbi:MAG: cellulase family glycosylhydrolase [Cyclobacteriaceae bacterium]